MDSNKWLFEGWQTSKDIYQLCVNPGYNLENLPGAMDNNDGC